MTPRNVELLDRYVSPKVIAGPSASSSSQAAAVALRADQRHRRLVARLHEVGFFEPAPAAYACRIAFFVVSFAIAYASLLATPSACVRVCCVVVIGFVLTQGGFVAHEATHGSISRNPRAIALVGHLFQSLLVGLSFSYFWRSHELHHFHTNEEGVDPDTEFGVFSVSSSAARTKRGLGRWMTRNQFVLIPLLLPIWGLSMKYDSIAYVLRNPKKTRVDQLALALHGVLWFAVPACAIGIEDALLNYLGWLAVSGVYLGVVIPINHVGKPLLPAEVEMSFVEQQLSVTRNLKSSLWRDFFFMGLNCHIEHHLFPHVPSTRLHRGREIIRDFCREEGLPYCEQSFAAAAAEAHAHLAKVARI
jgi:fatty acid desaturase